MGVFAEAVVKAAIERGATTDQVASIVKCLFWNLALMLHSYHTARKKCLEKTAGISPELLERLIAVSAKEIYEEMMSLLKD